MLPPVPTSSGVLPAKVLWKLRSGLVLGLFCDFPEEKTSLIFLAGDLARREPAMLFLLTDKVSALSFKPGMGKTGVLSETGCECGDTFTDVLAGTCMVGMRGVWSGSASWLIPLSSVAVVFMRGEEVVRYPA